MFLYHIAMSLGLMVLLFAAAFIFFMKAYAKVKVPYISYIAYIVLILSALGVVCSFYHGTKYWVKGEYTCSCPMIKFMEKMHRGTEQK